MLASSLEAPEKYYLRLYVCGGTPRSIVALRNLKKLCHRHLPGRCHIEVIDLGKHPELAQDDQILAVPTLVRRLPSPIRKFIGNLSNPNRILVDFDLRPNDTSVIGSVTGVANAS